MIQGDLTRPPIRRESMELIYSIGVLHHLDEPAAGFRTLAPLLTRDGTLVAWLYAREGNETILMFLDPLRRLTGRLSLAMVRGLASLMAGAVWVGLKALYGPARSRPALRRLLPYESYLSDLAAFPFREVHSIVFDQFLPPMAHYMRRDEVERCFRDGGLILRSLRWHYRNSWAATGARDRLF